ncbi:unnamed protein product [Schistosoma turkestanicum]|nr:unnamed protein product [Schistosoma turkestanicum]
MLKQNVLLSNVEQTTDLPSTNPNIDAYPRLSGCLLKNNLSDKLHHSSKQVRFRPNVSIDSSNHLADDLSCDGLNELNTVTSSVDNSDSIPHLRNHYSPENVPTRSPSYNVSEGVRENNVNKVYNLSTDIESHLMSNCQNTSSFRTTDHLPQQPLSSSPHSSVSGFRSCHSDVRRSSSDQDPRELLSSSFTQPDNLSLSSLTDLSCLDSDNSFSNHDYGTLNFSIPVSHTVKTLEREIKALSMKVNNASKNVSFLFFSA